MNWRISQAFDLVAAHDDVPMKISEYPISYLYSSFMFDRIFSARASQFNSPQGLENKSILGSYGATPYREELLNRQGHGHRIEIRHVQQSTPTRPTERKR